MLLVAIAAIPGAAHASQHVAGTYVQLYTNDDGLWYDSDSTYNGIQTDLDGDSSWDDWIEAGSPWHNLTWEWDQGGSAYSAWGNSAYGTADWTTTASSDLSTADYKILQHVYESDDLTVTKTEAWATPTATATTTTWTTTTTATAS